MTKGAVVLEVAKKSISLLTDEGAFISVPASKLPAARYVGQHVVLPGCSYLDNTRILLVAAACLFLLLFVPGAAQLQAYAYIAIDSSASFEVVVDRHWRVLEISVLNNEAVEFLNGEDYYQASLTKLLMDYEVWANAKGDDWALITYTAGSEMPSLTWDLSRQTTALNSLELYFLETELSAHRVATGHGVSVSRGLLYAEAETKGFDLPLASIREDNPLQTIAAMGTTVEEFLSSSPDKSSQHAKLTDAFAGKPSPDNSVVVPIPPDPIDKTEPGDDTELPNSDKPDVPTSGKKDESKTAGDEAANDKQDKDTKVEDKDTENDKDAKDKEKAAKKTADVTENVLHPHLPKPMQNRETLPPGLQKKVSPDTAKQGHRGNRPI